MQEPGGSWINRTWINREGEEGKKKLKCSPVSELQTMSLQTAMWTGDAAPSTAVQDSTSNP